MGVMNCPFCGKELPQESKFCPYCMEQISVPVNVSVPEKRNSKKVITVTIILLVLALTIGGILLYYNGKNEANTNSGTANTPIQNSPVNNEINNPAEPEESESDNIENDKGDTELCVNGHQWVELTDIVHYDEVGHYETVKKQRQVTKHKCPVCYKSFSSVEEYYSHFDNTHKPSYDGDPISILRKQYTSETTYESYEVEQWVVDKEAYDETLIVGYKCEICGEEKDN